MGTTATVNSSPDTQYTSTQFAAFCDLCRIRTSVGRTGVCRDNASTESFFAPLKNEMYHRHRFDTGTRARLAVAEHIEIFYNRQRLRSAIGYRTLTPSCPVFSRR
jgi:putative transposase